MRKTAELKAPSAGGPSYRIGVGDVLQVSVWEEPQFTESAVVRPDGMISIPLVSEAVVAGLTPESAADDAQRPGSKDSFISRE